MKTAILLAVLGLSAHLAQAQAPSGAQLPQLNRARLPEDQQRASIPVEGAPFRLPINTVTGSSRVDNAAGRQLKGDKLAFSFLDTLPNSGSAIYISSLKPCGVIMPHSHPRATEQYLMISGVMNYGLAEESSGRQNVTGSVAGGESFIVPQGLLHFNSNRGCSPIVFLQIFDNSDPGTVAIIGGLAALSRVDPAIAASNTNATASQFGGFTLDPTCLANCGLSSSGSPDSLSTLSADLQKLLGVTSSAPATAPAAASSGR